MPSPMPSPDHAPRVGDLHAHGVPEPIPPDGEPPREPPPIEPDRPVPLPPDQPPPAPVEPPGPVPGPLGDPAPGGPGGLPDHIITAPDRLH